MKMTEREWALPTLSMVLATVNEASGLGLDFEVIRLVVCASLGYSLIRTVHKIFELRYGKAKK